MSRPRKNPAAPASVAQAPSGPYTSISDVERRVIENAGTGEALVRLDRKITDGLNLVHERIRDLSKDIKDARSEHRADIAELRSGMKADNDALRTEMKGDNAELRSELKGDIAGLRTELKGDIAELRTEMKAGQAELKDMIRALTAEGAANRELVGEVRAMRRLVWILAAIIFGIGITAVLNPAAVNAAVNSIFGG